MVHFISWLSDLMLEPESGSFSWSSRLSAQWAGGEHAPRPGEASGRLRGRRGTLPARDIHTPPWIPGAAQPPDSSDNRRLQPHMPSGQGAAGGSLPLHRPLPPLLASASPAPFPPPPLRVLLHFSARARWPKMPRARDSRRREPLTPTREEPRQEKAESGWRGGRTPPAVACSGLPPPPCVRAGPAAPPSAAIALAPERARPRPGSPTRASTAPCSAWPSLAAGKGRGGMILTTPAGRIPPWERIIGPGTPRVA